MDNLNKIKYHTCKYCGHRDLNRFYGIKSYDNYPVGYEAMYYRVIEQKCAWCTTEYYVLMKDEIWII